MRFILDYNPRLRRMALSSHTDRSFDWTYDYVHCDLKDYDDVFALVLDSFRKLANKGDSHETSSH